MFENFAIQYFLKSWHTTRPGSAIFCTWHIVITTALKKVEPEIEARKEQK